MAELTKLTLFKAQPGRAETHMEKISRAAMAIVRDETETRRVKMERLRKTRLERDASIASERTSAAVKVARKTPRSKASNAAK